MWDDAKAMNAAALTLALIALVALVGGALAWAVRQPAFAYRTVVVETSLARADAAHVESIIRGELSGTFFTLNLPRARAAIATVPWVKTVALRRQWPGTLAVMIEEHQPLARWNEGALVDTTGEVFTADYDGDLPQFSGPDGRAGDVAARYRAWKDALAPLGLALNGVALSPRDSWSLAAARDDAPLKIELGRTNPDERLARLVANYPRTVGALVRNGTNVGYVDLRYRAGFAVRVPGFREKPVKGMASGTT
ncbi:MAG: cell division protein FtsQ/DivIB [Proteobacteria bacterium]|nr:cell division protein FtsQ/DivIB [Pseudomonadota bacterium]